MQGRTINNALIALRKQGGPQGKIAEMLLDMRGVALPRCVQDRPFKRGQAARIVLTDLKTGPKTNTQLGQAIRRFRADLTARSASNRSYQALLRLEDKGLVVRDFGPDGCLWRLILRAIPTITEQ